MRNRREFLELSLRTAAAVGLAGTGWGMEQTTDPGTASAGATPMSEFDAYNYAVGTQTIGASYQFTDKPRLVETADAIRQMGSSVIKFNLGEARQRETGTGGSRTLRDDAAHDPAVRQVFNMPFGHYLLWAYSASPGSELPASQPPRDQELYDLCCYLLKTYNGSGKTFYLGHWEGDWELRGKAGGQEDPSPQRIADKIRWLNLRQQAVDDAKRDTPHRGVQVFCYAEVNQVRDAMQGRPTMANEVIPHTQIDFVSYSSYDTANGNDAAIEVPKALDYIASKLPPKPAIKGKRVWIGEYGYPAFGFSPEEQAASSRRLIRTALQWGCPFVLYWEMYNNEVDKDGKQRGFWLIDDKGVKQPVYYVHQRLLEWARGYVAEYVRTEHHPPSFDAYRKKAVEFLDAWKE